VQICLIVSKEGSPDHPVVPPMVERLRADHEVRLLDVRSLTGASAIAEEEVEGPAGLYLLRGDAPQALEIARHLEARGDPVWNSCAASVACQDRALMAWKMQGAGLPWPRTEVASSLGTLLNEPHRLASMSFPIVVKSRYCHRERDLVRKIDSIEELRVQSLRWRDDPVVIQEYLPNDGWDIKLWVIGTAAFANRRRSRIHPPGAGGDVPIPAHDVPFEWRRSSLEAGQAFDLQIYGVDLLLVGNQRPVLVDVNAFPSCRNASGAPDALSGIVEDFFENRGAFARRRQLLH
jgi:ribosomal protein S6--L-glutamate ligase